MSCRAASTADLDMRATLSIPRGESGRAASHSDDVRGPPLAAFSIGMAYSASNVTQSSTASRRIAMGHALLSYFFGTFVFAVAINLVVGLSQGAEA
jgi:hypothetical protein